MNIKYRISLFKLLTCVVLTYSVSGIYPAKAGVYFSSKNDGGSRIEVFTQGGFVGPVPYMGSGVPQCVTMRDPNYLFDCSTGESTNTDSQSAYVQCVINVNITSMRNITTGKQLETRANPSNRELGVGSRITSVGNAFGSSFASIKKDPLWKDVLCSSHEGDYVSDISNGGLQYIYTAQGFTPGDILEICVTENYINTRETGSHFNSVYAKSGPSYCTRLDTVAPTCVIKGDLNIDLGSVGVGRSTYGDISVALLCPEAASIRLSMVKENIDGTISLRNSTGNEIEAKTRMQVGQNAKSTDWSGIVGLSTPIVFSADINNVGAIPGEFSGQTVIILSNN